MSTFGFGGAGWLAGEGCCGGGGGSRCFVISATSFGTGFDSLDAIDLLGDSFGKFGAGREVGAVLDDTGGETRAGAFVPGVLFVAVTVPANGRPLHGRAGVEHRLAHVHDPLLISMGHWIWSGCERCTFGVRADGCAIDIVSGCCLVWRDRAEPVTQLALAFREERRPHLEDRV